MTDLTPIQLRNAFGRFMTGVVVVTTRRQDDGAPVGFTANSFSSVSIDPPLISVCPGEFLSSYEVFKTCDAFTVSILAHDQQAVAETFASYKGDRFARVDWEDGALGLPLIKNTAASFECSTHQIVPAGDHIVLLGEIKHVVDRERSGLGYHAGAFFTLG